MRLNVDVGQIRAGWGDPDGGPAFLGPPAFLEDEGHRRCARSVLFERLDNGSLELGCPVVVEQSEQETALPLNGLATTEGGLKQGFGFRHARGQATTGGGPEGFPFFRQQRVLMCRIDNELVAVERPVVGGHFGRAIEKAHPRLGVNDREKVKCSGRAPTRKS